MTKPNIESLACVAIGICCAAMAGNAAAQSSTRAPPAIRVTVGGYMEQSFGYAHNLAGVRVSQARQTGFVPVVVARPNRLGQQADSEIWFSGRARLSNGWTAGFVVQLEGNTQFGDQIDDRIALVGPWRGQVVAP